MSFDPVQDASSSGAGYRRRTIAFTSGKGGVGKSNLVLNTGLLLARHGRRVALLDGDLGLANVTVLMGRAPKYDLRDVIAGDKRLKDIVMEGPNGLLIIPAGSGVAELANLAEAARSGLFEQLREIEESVDFLLIDTGAGISDTVLSLILASDESVVVTQPEPTALADAYALMKVVIQQFPAYPFHVLINMVRDGRQARQVQRSLAEILTRFLGYTPGDAGFVVMDGWVAQAVVQQVPFTVLAPRAPASRCLEDLVARLLGYEQTPAAAPAKTFWERVSEGPWRLT
jgi:flagellar biosynthesis protein FlhG